MTDSTAGWLWLTFKPDLCFEPCNVPFWGFQKSVPKWSHIDMDMKHDGTIYCSMFPVVFRHCWSKFSNTPGLVFLKESPLGGGFTNDCMQTLHMEWWSQLTILFFMGSTTKQIPFRGSRPDSQCRRHQNLLRTSGARGLKLDSSDVQILQEGLFGRRMS